MSSNYPWYEFVSDDSMHQGDFIDSCPIIIPPSSINEGESQSVDVRLINSVILSQSCDLINDKLEIVLVCPYYTLEEFLNGLPEDRTASKKARSRLIEELRKGNLPGYHLLNKDNTFKINDYITVDFKNVYGINRVSLMEQIRNIEENRIRLLPPYREHLSQAFARYFMRVGLPQDFKVEGYF